MLLGTFLALAGTGAIRAEGGGPSLVSEGDGARAAPAPSGAGASVPRLFGASSGRFAVIAESGADGVRLAELAEAAWRDWRGPFGLPARLPTSITVRLVPESLWGFGAERSRVVAEPGGVVSVWIRAGDPAGVERDRRWLIALAEGVLRRKAFLLGLDPARTTVPAWLAAAAAEASVVSANPAMLDAWQAAVRGLETPTKLRGVLLASEEATATDSAVSVAAYGVWLWLQEEGARSGAWARFVNALVGGESPGAALAREYGRLTPRPEQAREWELVWRVALARLARMRATPVMEADESRRRIEALSRIVVLDTEEGRERVLSAPGEWATREESWPATERKARARLLAADFPRMHPFYRNAAGSLGRAWQALADGEAKRWREAAAEWEADLAAGRALEAASARLLERADPGRSP